MQFSGSPSPTIQNIKQPSSTINKDSLVFTYPILIDDSLKPYSEIIRDFFTVQFITQIKISNILDIQTAATRANYIQVDNRHINPAEELAKNLGGLTRDYTSYFEKSQEYSKYAPNDKYEYQNKINQLRQFIVDQIKFNPTYKQLNPIVSTITIENLIDIPLIIGTKQYFIPNSVLFWILFISAGYTPKRDANPLTLDNSNNLKTIKNIMSSISAADYMKYFGTDELEKYQYSDQQPSHRVHQLVMQTESEMDKALKYLGYALNPKQWADESGIKNDTSLTVQSTTAINNTIVVRDTILQKCNTLFNGMMGNAISPLFNSVGNALVSSDEIDISRTITLKISKILEVSNQLFDNIFSSVLSSSMGGLPTEDEDNRLIKELQAKLDVNSNICQIVPRISVESTLKDIQRTYFGLVGMSTSRFEDFVDNVVKLSTQLAANTNTLQNFIGKLATDKPLLDSLFINYKEAIRTIIFNDNKSVTNSIDDNTFEKNAGLFDIFTRVLVNNGDGGQERQIHFGDRIRELLNTPTGASVNKRILMTLTEALTNIIYFLSLYCFLSYICEYFKTVVEDVKLQKRDALEFPNYCLVLKAEVIEKLYMSLAAISFKTQKDIYTSKINNRNKSEEDQVNEKNVLQPFKLNEKHIANMIRLINDRLNVPNLIIIDEKSKTIYYKFMFHSPGQINQIPLESMKTFINHQKDVIQVF